MRTKYEVHLFLNGRFYTELLIDDHYRIKHTSSVNDLLILEIFAAISGQSFKVDALTIKGWSIYNLDPYVFQRKPYRVIFCSHPSETYIGVINFFRRSFSHA